MDRTRPRVKRINLDEPAELAALIRSGAIWNLPQFWQKAIDAISDELVPLSDCRDMPYKVAEGSRRQH